MNSIFYEKLLKKWCPRPSSDGALTCLFKNVRDIPYGSTGERNPENIVNENLGSCSGKHLLLSNLFNLLGYENKVITCLHYFNDALPSSNAYPERFQEILQNFRVIDFHHFIRLKKNDKWLSVDATWDAPLINFGFPVNYDWKGDADTIIAVQPVTFFPETGDLIGLKKKLVAEMTHEDREIRAEFLRLLTNWLKEARSKV
jgi:hypothetical protein